MVDKRTRDIDGEVKDMYSQWYNDIVAFHKINSVIINSEPTWVGKDIRDLRKSLIDEEHKEFVRDYEKADLVGLADGLIDLAVVTIGTNVSFGLGYPSGWNYLVFSLTPRFRRVDRMTQWLGMQVESCLNVLGQEDGDCSILSGKTFGVLLGIMPIASEMNLPMHRLWNEVHRANMDKAGGPKRADGKVLKPEGWKPPDIHGILEQWGWTDDRGTIPEEVIR